MTKWENTLLAYKKYSLEQIEAFRRNPDLAFPYLYPENIDPSKITLDEKEKLAAIDITSLPDVLLGVNDLFPRFLIVRDRKISEKKAEEKLCHIGEYIPMEDTIDFNSFYIVCSSNIKITIEELKWLYLHGYIPHLYVKNGEPRFHRNMWFTVDMAIRYVREKTGLGIKSGFQDYKNIRPWQSISMDIRHVHYMYYSWNIIEAIIKQSEEEARKRGLKNVAYRIASRNIGEDIRRNEGKILANKLFAIQKNDRILPYKKLAEVERDTFALFAAEAFPVDLLIKYADTTKWRTWFLTEGQSKCMLATSYPIPINTYKNRMLCDGYGLLCGFMEGALSLIENRSYMSPEAIALRYQRDKTDSKRHCNVCGELFAPKRGNQVTCAKQSCIQENKNRTKRKQLKDKYRHFS